MCFKKSRLIISLIMCCTILLCTMTGCSNNKGNVKFKYSNEKLQAYIDDLDDISKSGIYRADDKKMACLSNMELKLSNDYMNLYVGRYYDIALLDKTTASIYFSNYAIYDSNVNAEQNEAGLSSLYSQVNITYFNDSNIKAQMYSYPDCISDKKNQVEMSVENNCLNMKYCFGVKTDEQVVCSAFSQKSFDELDKKASKLIDEGKLDEMVYIRFKEAYSKIVYEDLGAMTRDLYTKQFSLFKKLGSIYVLREDVTQPEKNNIIKVSKLLEIDNKYISLETDKLGGSAKSATDDPYFEIPVSYELQGRDLLVSIDTANVFCAEDYKLTRISLLNWFGAVSKDSSGYSFIPDRSGAIIENNTTIQNITSLELPFYGSDFGKEIINSEKINPYAPFPIFGIYDGERSLFGIVESGDAIGGVNAQVATSELPYNSVSPWLNFYEQDLQNAYAVKNTNSNSDNISGTNYVYMNSTPDCKYTVRYHFLYGENATYSGMASYYQKYLLKTGSLSENKTSEHLNLDLNVIGAITKKQIKLGIPVESVVSATKFKDAQDFAKQLKDKGIVDLNMIYLGCYNGGLDFKIPSKLKVEKVLGSKNEYNSLISSLSKSGYNFLPTIDYTRVYSKGNGLNKNTQISRYINQKVAYYSDYIATDNSRNEERISYLINPYTYSDIVKELLDNISSEMQNIFIPSVASYLSGNYDEKYQLNREQTKILTQDSLKMLTDKGYKLTLDGANVYALKYASSLSDVPVTFGSYNIESYSVPFVGMVLHGYIDYTGPQLNQQSDYKKALLQTIESGAGLNYIVMTENQMILQDTNYSDYYSVFAEDWKTQIIDTYNSLNKVFSDLSNCKIVDHKILNKGIVSVEYSNGTVIYINYNDNVVQTPVGNIDALNFKVIS